MGEGREKEKGDERSEKEKGRSIKSRCECRFLLQPKK
jgi:hypothetical protein